MTKPIDPTDPPNGSAQTPQTASVPPPAPGTGAANGAGVHAMRRGGARREVSERVNLKGLGDTERLLDGWALNVSRGGLRAILEEKVDLGERFEVTLGDGDMLVKTGRIVWVQEEPDGVIVGIEFLPTGGAGSGVQKSAPPSVPPPPPER